MNTTIEQDNNANIENCPICGQKLINIEKFSICPDHGQVSGTESIVSLRIFISYGHDRNADLVLRIKSDLEKRGHNVWFDKAEIKGGYDWRRTITDGIMDSHRVLSILSKYSTRDPGVCLDEIAIAVGAKGGNIQTILVESEQEVQAPPSISHIQWLDMHDWKVQYDSGEAVWEKWYQEKLAQVVAVVESDESRCFAGEIRTLEEQLKPVLSDSRIFQLIKKGLVGREWLIDTIEQWRTSPDHSSRLLWIMGAPGVGKSAFAAHLAHYGRDKVIAVQFCEYDKPEHSSAHRIIRSLAFQIASRLPDYRRFLQTLPEITELHRRNPDELFDYLLSTPLMSVIDGGRESYLIVIDALDEACEKGRNELVDMLARNADRLPDWLGFVVTSRPEFDVTGPFQGLNPVVIDARTDSNREDIRNYLRLELASNFEKRGDVDEIVETVLEKSEGVFLYVERFCDEVQRDENILDNPNQFPQGLDGIFSQHFRRQFQNLEKYREVILPALSVILAAHGALSVDMLGKMFSWREGEIGDFTIALGSLFPVTNKAGMDVITPHHKSVTDWLTDRRRAGHYVVDMQEGHRRLADYCWQDVKIQADKLSNYSMSYLPTHLVELDRWEALMVLVMEPRWAFVEKWVQEGGEQGIRFLVGLYEYLSSNRGNALAKAGIATQIARVYSLRGNYKQTQEWLDSAIMSLSWWHGRRTKAVALHELASLHLYQGEGKDAEKIYRRALHYCIWGIPQYRDVAAANLIGLASVARADGQLPGAISLAQKASRWAHAAGDSRYEIAAKRLIGATFNTLGKYSKAKACLQESLHLCDKHGEYLEKSRVLLVLGSCHYRAAILRDELSTQAKVYFDQALEEAERIINFYCVVESKLSLFFYSLAEGDISAAERWLGKLTSISAIHTHPELLAGVELGRASLVYIQGDAVTAKDRYQRTLGQWNNESGIFVMQARIRGLVGLGAVQWHLGEEVNAQISWEKALDSSIDVSEGEHALTKARIRFARDHPYTAPR